MDALDVEPILVKSVLLTYDEEEALKRYAEAMDLPENEALRSIVVRTLARR